MSIERYLKRQTGLHLVRSHEFKKKGKKENSNIRTAVCCNCLCGIFVHSIVCTAIEFRWIVIADKQHMIHGCVNEQLGE